MATASSCLAATNPTTFSNPSPITINDNSAASPYPSPITVSNLTGVVSHVSIQVNNLSHTLPSQVNLLLVAPTTSSRALIFSHCGGATSVSNITVTLDDAAPSPLPQNSPLVSGLYQPAKYPPSVSFPTPAPTPGASNFLATFKGINPNGTWNLYVVDDQTGDTGSIAGGWSLTVTTATLFTNSPATIIINDSNSPPTLATPYPSTITVSNLVGTVNKVTVRLLDVTHDFPNDIDMLLVGPQGQNVVLWGEVGGPNFVTNINVTLDDNASQSILDDTAVTSGTYLPSTISTNLVWPSLPTNLVVTQTFTPQLSTFNGTAPNGPWTLYVVDDSPGGAGEIVGGWVLSITATPKPALSLQVSGSNAILSWPATAQGLTLQSNADLTSTNWVTVTPAPVYSAGLNVVTNPVGAGNLFYRLSK